MNIHKSLLYLFSLTLILSACVRSPGEGGRASITGSVDLVRRVQINNPASTVDTIAAADAEVFIVYGENVSPDDRVFTNPDGDFAFNWLRTGDYTLYVYSEDTTVSSFPLPKIAISVNANIDDRDDVVMLDPIVIFDEY
jgi:hypothetical protein